MTAVRHRDAVSKPTDAHPTYSSIDPPDGGGAFMRDEVPSTPLQPEEALAQVVANPTPVEERRTLVPFDVDGHDDDDDNIITNGESHDDDGTLVMSIDDAIDALGIGRFQHRVLVAAGLCFAADAMEIMLLSFLSTELQDEWNLTDAQTESITSSVFVGALLGSLVLGRLGDFLGRRPVFIICGLIISFFGLATAFTGGYAALLSTRFMVGFGVGGLTVPFDILAEFLPVKGRGKYLLLIEYFWTAGSLFVPAIGYLTLGEGGSWQLFVFICAIPCFLSAIIGAIYVPESPRWLLAEGKGDKALDILRGAAITNGKHPEDVFPEGTRLEEDDEEESGNFSDLLKPKWRCLTLLLWGTWAGFAFSYYGTIIAVTRVFEEEDTKGVADGDDASPNFDYQAIFISSSAEIVGTTIVVLTVERLGRIPTQMISYALGGVSVFMLCALASRANRAVLVSISFTARIFEMCASCVTWVSTAELLTTEIRSTGHSAANAVARIGGFFSPYVVEGNTPLLTVGIVMLVIHGLVVICVSQLPETKGKALGSAVSDCHNHEARTTENSDKEPAYHMPGEVT